MGHGTVNIDDHRVIMASTPKCVLSSNYNVCMHRMITKTVHVRGYSVCGERHTKFPFCMPTTAT